MRKERISEERERIQDRKKGVERGGRVESDRPEERRTEDIKKEMSALWG